MILKRTLPFIAILLLAFASCQPDKKDFTALSAIPQNAAVVIEIHRLDRAAELFKNSSFLQQSLSITEIYAFSKLSDNLFKALRLDPVKSKASLYAYAHLAGAKKYDWVICASLASIKNTDGLHFSDDWTISKRNYANGEILTITNGEATFFALNHLGVFAVSLNENMIEEIIRQSENNISVENNQLFKKHQDIATHSDPFTIYVNFKEINGIGKSLLKNSKPDWLTHFGTWVELDASEENGNINLNGASINPDSTHAYLTCFNNVGKVKLSAPSIIPASAIGAVMFGTDNFNIFIENQDQYLKHWNLYRSTKKRRDAIGINLNSKFYPFIDNEFGVIYFEPKTSVAESKMAYIKVKEPQAAMETLITLSGDAKENYREHFIYQLKREKLLPAALGRAFKSLNKPYFILHDDWIIFSNNLLMLKTTINDYLANKTWSESSGFKSVANHFSKSANIWVLSKNPGAYNLSLMFMDDAGKKAATKNKAVFTEPDWGGIQITNKGEASIFSVFIGKQAHVAKESNQVWSTQLEAPILGKPQFIYNHRSKQNNILIQDTQHKLYWLNTKGKVLWTNQLDGEILGKVVQVDLFKNKKLQLAFNTTRKFYILDRLGRNVAPFPISVNAEITAPLAVFDYEKTRKYRFLVCSKKGITMFNTEGKEVKGWQFNKPSSPVKAKPKHYVLGGKDYIFVAESNGKINVLNRKGESRLGLNSTFKVSNHIYLQMGASIKQSRIVSIDFKDNLTYLFLNDKKDNLEIDLDEDLEYFVFDGKNILLAGGNQLINQHQDYPFNVAFNENILYEPGLNKFGDKNFFTAVTEDEQIHALDKTGKELPGFPMYGNTDATMGRITTNGSLFLVGGTQDGTVFLYRIIE